MTELLEAPPPAISRALKHWWTHFIRQVYEGDPLLCPQCGGAMRIIGFNDQPAVIEKSLTTLVSGRTRCMAHGRLPPPRSPGWNSERAPPPAPSPVAGFGLTIDLAPRHAPLAWLGDP